MREEGNADEPIRHPPMSPPPVIGQTVIDVATAPDTRRGVLTGRSGGLGAGIGPYLPVAAHRGPRCLRRSESRTRMVSGSTRGASGQRATPGPQYSRGVPG
jgi:hypothetical protein